MPEPGLRLRVLGSGDASGIPRADCADPACACAQARAGQRPGRGNSAALVEAGGVRIAIDTGAGAQACDALLLTHYHADHAGHREAFGPVPAWGPAAEPDDAFPIPAGVIPVAPYSGRMVGGVRCTPLPLNHPVPVLGWVIEHAGRRLAWLTDTYGIPAAALGWLAEHPCDLLAIDTTFAPGVARAPLKGHGDLIASLAAIAASGAGRALLIHVGHGLQNWLDAHPAAIPGHVEVAHDGLCTDA